MEMLMRWHVKCAHGLRCHRCSGVGPTTGGRVSGSAAVGSVSAPFALCRYLALAPRLLWQGINRADGGFAMGLGVRAASASPGAGNGGAAGGTPAAEKMHTLTPNRNGVPNVTRVPKQRQFVYFFLRRNCVIFFCAKSCNYKKKNRTTEKKS